MFSSYSVTINKHLAYIFYHYLYKNPMNQAQKLFLSYTAGN